MARAPINYMLDIRSPVEQAMRGYQFGLGEVQAEREEGRAEQRFGMEQERFGMAQELFRSQQAAAAQQAAASRQAAERKQAFYSDFSRVVTGELPRRDLLAAYPDFASTMKDTFDLIPDPVADARVGLGKRVQVALNNGRTDIADNLLTVEAEAARNSGLEAYARQLDELRAQMELNPRLVFEEIGLQLDAFGAESQDWRSEPNAVSTIGKLRADLDAGRITQEDFDVATAEDGPLVQNILGEQETEFAKVSGREAATFFSELTKQGVAASRNITELENLEALLSVTETGAGASFKAFLGQYGVNTDGLDEIQAARASINRMIPAQRPEGSGVMSDADLELFKQSVPALINQPGGNQIIIDTIRAINEYDVAVSIISGDALDGRITPAAARKALRELPNPMANFKAPTASAPAPSAQPEAAPVVIDGITIRRVD